MTTVRLLLTLAAAVLVATWIVAGAIDGADCLSAALDAVECDAERLEI